MTNQPFNQNPNEPSGGNTPPQADQLDQLRALLEKETETYSKVEDALKEKKTILVEGKYKDLPTLDQRLIALGQKSTHLETARLELMQTMGYENHTLASFIDRLHPTQIKPMLDARKNLLRVVGDVQTLNQQTKNLLDMSIQWVEDTVGVIADAVAPEQATYSAQGQRKSNAFEDNVPSSTIVQDA